MFNPSVALQLNGEETGEKSPRCSSVAGRTKWSGLPVYMYVKKKLNHESKTTLLVLHHQENDKQASSSSVCLKKNPSFLSVFISLRNVLSLFFLC